jgi:hypothetical protein
MNESSDHWRWGDTIVACLEAMQAQSIEIGIVDFEVIPPFNGSAERVFVWFIVNSGVEVAPFRESSQTSAQTELRRRLSKTEYPQSGLDTLQFDVTSLEDISKGGGRFAYFR